MSSVNKKYDDHVVYDKYLGTESSNDDSCCNDNCSCCPPGLVALKGDDGCDLGCVTPNDAESYYLAQKVVPEGYVRTFNPQTGEYLGDLTVADSIDLVTYYNTLPYALSADVAKTNVLEFGQNNGTASAVVSGGTGPYVLVWKDSTDTVADPANLPAGSYTLTATDNVGAVVVVSFVITEPDALNLIVNTQPESVGNSSFDGKASAVVSGGIMPYSYEWRDNLSTPIGQTTQTATNLETGTYQIFVTDANGIVISDTNVVINALA